MAEESKGVGLSNQKEDHLGPHRDICQSYTRGRGSKKQVRFRESKGEDKLGLRMSFCSPLIETQRGVGATFLSLRH